MKNKNHTRKTVNLQTQEQRRLRLNRKQGRVFDLLKNDFSTRSQRNQTQMLTNDCRTQIKARFTLHELNRSHESKVSLNNFFRGYAFR